jgi:hypothetical protein
MSRGLMRRAFLAPGFAQMSTMRTRSMNILHTRGRRKVNTQPRAGEEGGKYRASTLARGLKGARLARDEPHNVLESEVQAREDGDEGKHSRAQQHHELTGKQLRVLVRYVENGPGVEGKAHTRTKHQRRAAPQPRNSKNQKQRCRLPGRQGEDAVSVLCIPPSSTEWGSCDTHCTPPP